MPALKNPRWERFAANVAAGMQGPEAYSQAGFKGTSRKGLRTNASRLLAMSDVRERVTELTAQIVESSKLSRKWVLDGLRENFERAMQRKPVLDAEGNPTGNYTYQGQVANKALELIGQELGMFVEHIEQDTTIKVISDKPMTPEQWASEYGVPGEEPLKIGTINKGDMN